MSGLCPVAILAGGRATRLGALGHERPKALMEVAGRPFLEWQLELLRAQGARRVVLCVGHLAEQVEAAVGDGRRFGLEVRYAFDGPMPAGTAGALRGALAVADGEELMALYGDTYLRIDYADVLARFRAAGRAGLMTVLRNEGRWDASNSQVEGDRVVAHDKRSPTPAMAWIDYGLGVLRAEALGAGGERDLNDLYARLAANGQLTAYEATERFYEIGTPASLRETDAFLRGSRSGHPRLA